MKKRVQDTCWKKDDSDWQTFQILIPDVQWFYIDIDSRQWSIPDIEKFRNLLLWKLQDTSWQKKLAVTVSNILRSDLHPADFWENFQH